VKFIGVDLAWGERRGTGTGTVALDANRTILHCRAAATMCANRSRRPISVGARPLTAAQQARPFTAPLSRPII